ncbi:MAG TPA: galactosyltransferase-related protein, partial [Thermoanaerobaculia bacterium]|nr:galactosyltransferase-related protein [Thermoanaerobaculia bacterium]
AEVVVASCGGDPPLLGETLGGISSPAVRVVEIPAPRFNKGLALNLGVYAARAGRLFLLDTDVLLDEAFLPRALARLDGRSFVTVQRVVESHPAPADEAPGLAEIAWSVELVGRNGRKARVETNRLRFRDGSRSGPGLILLERGHFLAVDGMNSDLEGWGWEDLDLVARLQLALGLKRRTEGRAVHLTHGDEVRDLAGQSRGTSEQANFVQCLANYRLGCFTGTYGDDAATWA